MSLFDSAPCQAKKVYNIDVCVYLAWVEKYRPKTIEDISSQEHTVAVLKKTLNSTNVSESVGGTWKRMSGRRAEYDFKKHFVTVTAHVVLRSTWNGKDE